MEVMLNLVDTLIEIEVHKNWKPNPVQFELEIIDPVAEFHKEKEGKVNKFGQCFQLNLLFFLK